MRGICSTSSCGRYIVQVAATGSQKKEYVCKQYLCKQFCSHWSVAYADDATPVSSRWSSVLYPCFKSARNAARRVSTSSLRSMSSACSFWIWFVQ